MLVFTFHTACRRNESISVKSPVFNGHFPSDDVLCLHDVVSDETPEIFAAILSMQAVYLASYLTINNMAEIASFIVAVRGGLSCSTPHTQEIVLEVLVAG